MRTLLPVRLSLPALLILAVAAAPQPADTVLISLDRRQPVRVPAELLERLTPYTSLQQVWIAEAPADLPGTLRAQGVRFEVLDPAPGATRTYYLAFSTAPGELAAMAAVGQVRQVEEGVAVFWSDVREAREVVPARVELAVISPSPARQVSLEPLDEGRPSAIRRQQEPVASRFDPTIAQLVASVSSDRLSSGVAALESFRTRYASTAACEAAGASIYEAFEALGLDVQTDYFRFPASSLYLTANIVATLPGRTDPGQVVIIGGHYDSFSNQPATLAPGADDNASGTAAVLEAARVMSGHAFDYTIRFIAFGAEEWGLYGSRHYAQQARERGERILGVVNLDMIGYVDVAPEDLEVIAQPESEWLADAFLAAAAQYAPLQTRKRVAEGIRGSDHAPFWDQGYSAVLGIEDYPLTYPRYHQTTDLLAGLSVPFMTASARAAAATVAVLAQPMGALPAPTGLRATRSTSRSLFSTAKSVRLEWQAPSGGAAGYNIYRTTTRRSGYVKVNGAPVTSTFYVDRFLAPSTQYYYVVTAVDAQGRESNYSQEVAEQ